MSRQNIISKPEISSHSAPGYTIHRKKKNSKLLWKNRYQLPGRKSSGPLNFLIFKLVITIQLLYVSVLYNF